MSTHDACAALRTRAGARFDRDAIRADLERLFATGAYDDVQVDATPAGEGVALTFQVQERPIVGAVRVELSAPGGQPSELSTPEVLRKANLSVGAPLDPADVHAAVRAVQRGYVDRGFRLARVDAEVSPDAKSPGPARADVVLKIAEGPKCLIKRWEWKGLAGLTEAQVRGAMVTEGDRFNAVGGIFGATLWEHNALAIMALYYDRGFPTVRMGEPIVAVDPRGDVTVTVEITEGKPYRIGALHVAGALDADEKSYLKMLGVKPGDPFNRSALMRGIDAIRAHHDKRGDAVDVEPMTELEPDKALVGVTVKVTKR